MYLVTAKEMQTMDRETIQSFGIPGQVLMENAGRGATRMFRQHFGQQGYNRIGVLAGRGNNGGDGFVMARYLTQAGANVTVYLLTEAGRLRGDALANFKLLQPLGIPVVEVPDAKRLAQQREALAQTEIWIDAILGTGLKSDVRGFFKTMIETLNGFHRPVFAVDIPSGLNADTGQVCGVCVSAQATATFGCAKIGHLVYPGAEYTGKLGVVDIGIPSAVASAVKPQQQVLTARELAAELIPRPADSHKGRTGHMVVVGGSPGKTGAAAMTAISGMRAGAGLVTVGVARSLNPTIENAVLETMSVALPETRGGVLGTSAFDPIMRLLDGKQCLALGPGLGTAAATRNLVHRLVAATSWPMVIDADGLNCLVGKLAVLKQCRAPVILTPHPGEMARLMQTSVATVQRDRIGCARKLALSLGLYVVLKGARTVIAHPDGMVFVNCTGNAGMASGGMGDVLTGLIAGFICQGYPPAAAAHLGVYLHGAAADHLATTLGPWGWLASDVMLAIPTAIQHLMRPGAKGAYEPDVL